MTHTVMQTTDPFRKAAEQAVDHTNAAHDAGEIPVDAAGDPSFTTEEALDVLDLGDVDDSMTLEEIEQRLRGEVRSVLRS